MSTNMTPADLCDPILLEEIEAACQIAPFLALSTTATIRLADKKTPIKPDDMLGDTVRQLWADLSSGVRQEYIETALYALRAARFDVERDAVCGRQIVYLGRRDNVVAGIFPKES